MRLSLVPLALAAALLFSGCGTERLEPTAAPVAAAPEPETDIEAIPEDFPLDAGLTTGLDTELKGPGPKAPGLRLDDLCPGLTWPAGTTGRLALLATGPEYAEVRELVTYASEDEAAAVVAGLRDGVPACTPGEGRVVTAHDADTGTDGVTFALTYDEGLGGTAYQVVRVGAAVLAVSESGEFSPESMAEYVPDLTAEVRLLTDRMACHWGAGCPEEPVTVSPQAGGPLAMGAAIADLREAAPALAVSYDRPCSLVSWTSPAGVRLSGAVTDEGGLVFVEGHDGVQTDQGLAVGATLDELRAAYPHVEEADNGLWYVDAGDTDLTIGVTGDVVTSVGVVADDQPCVG